MKIHARGFTDSSVRISAGWHRLMVEKTTPKYDQDMGC